MNVRLRISKHGLAWAALALLITVAGSAAYIEARTAQAITLARIVYLERELYTRMAAVERGAAATVRGDTDEHQAIAWHIQEIELRQDFTTNLKSMGMTARRALSSELYRLRLYQRMGPVVDVDADTGGK